MPTGFDLSEFATLLGVFAVALVVPGADFACVVRESLSFGRRSGLLAALGIGSAILVHAGYTVLGIGIVVSQSIIAFNVIKWAGVAYLVFLGISALRAKETPVDVTAADRPQISERPATRSLGVGFLTNLLNPKAALFFVSLFTAIVSHETPGGVQFGYGMVMAGIVAAWFALVAVFFTTPSIRAAFLRSGRWLNRITGIVFIALGIRLAFQRAN